MAFVITHLPLPHLRFVTTARQDYDDQGVADMNRTRPL